MSEIERAIEIFKGVAACDTNSAEAKRSAELAVAVLREKQEREHRCDGCINGGPACYECNRMGTDYYKAKEV